MADESVLLDTHVWIWLVTGNERLALSPALTSIMNAQEHGRVIVSTISVWEVAMLEMKGRIRLQFPMKQWIENALAAPGVQLQGVTPSIALESTRLPGEFHSDPADRMLMATARDLNIPFITADNLILAYADWKYMKVVAA